MKLWMSGYGGDGERSIAQYNCSDENDCCLWETSLGGASYLAVWEELLFVISEWEDGGAVHIFQKIGEHYARKDTARIPGGLACHIAYLPAQRALLGACYGSGEVFSFAVDVENARFGSLLTYQKQGSGAECSQGNTRAHCVFPNRSQTQVLSANIALDRLYLYDLSDGKLQNERFFQLPKGIGPRHLCWREDLHKVYVITEYSNEILTLDTGKEPFTLLNRTSTLQHDFVGESYGSTLVFSQDGRFLYAGNRGEDSIVIFAVDASGDLSLIGRTSCGGCWPRDLALVDNDAFLAVANQQSNSVVLLPRDPKNGLLGSPQRSFTLAGASFVQGEATQK